MTRSSTRCLWASALVSVLVGLPIAAAAHYGVGPSAIIAPAPVAASTPSTQSQWYADASSGRMRVGLTLVDGQAETSLPDPASLDFPATPRAILCQSDGQRYRECRTPFHGPVTLAREVSGTRCVEDENWGWREGKVWVDRGCAAVFVRIGET